MEDENTELWIPCLNVSSENINICKLFIMTLTLLAFPSKFISLSIKQGHGHLF
jgi:hypothetical protein